MIRARRAAVVCCTLGALVAAPGAAAQAPPAKLAASLARLFGPPARVDTLHVDSAAVLRISTGDSLLGFAQVGNVIGKYQPITFLVAMDPANRLRDVDILGYREPYGGEAGYDAWRKQFRGQCSACPS